MNTPAEAPPPSTLAAVKREHVRRVLSICRGDKRAAAKALGISPGQLYRLLAAAHDDEPEPQPAAQGCAPNIDPEAVTRVAAVLIRGDGWHAVADRSLVATEHAIWWAERGTDGHVRIVSLAPDLVVGVMGEPVIVPPDGNVDVQTRIDVTWISSPSSRWTES